MTKNKSTYLSQALAILTRTQGADSAQIRAMGFLQRRLYEGVRTRDKSPQRVRATAHEHAAPNDRS